MVATQSIKVLALIGGPKSKHGFPFVERQIVQMVDFGLEVQPFYLDTRTHPTKIIQEALRFREALRLFDADVVHAHFGTVTALFAVCFSKQPVVITFRGSDLNPSSQYSWIRGYASRIFSQIAALFAEQIICVSEELRQRLWWKKKRAEVILTGVNLRDFHPVARDEAREILRWNEADRIVLFNHSTARAPNKRLDLVDKAFSLLKTRLESAKLVVIKGDVAADLMPLYINAADVVVMTSDFEGSPNIVKEALACNTPICSVRVGDVPELLRGVENCFIVDREPTAIAEGILELVREPRRSNGRDFAYRFSADVHTERVCTALRRAAAWRAKTS